MFQPLEITSVSSTFDLAAYLARIEYSGPLTLTQQTLEGLHLAHATHIPFENLDIQLGRPIRLDLESLQSKLVRGRRGGYCFEQNTLLAAALEQLGFPVTTLAARVRFGATRILPHIHMLLKVEVEGVPWLADVGFGSEGLLQPVLLVPASVCHQFAWSFRLVEEQGLWVLQTLQGESWHDMYAFTLEPHYPVDFEMANYFVSTHPDSWFVQALTVQRMGLEMRHILRNRELTVTDGKNVTSTVIKDADALLDVLAKNFGLNFPSGTRFRCLAATA
jgi:N-hydroxyarylamine O-acetyltransferase